MAPDRSLGLAIAFAAALPSCYTGYGGPMVFRPTENASSTSPSGEPAAAYNLQDQSGARLAQIHVWSSGLVPDQAGGASLLRVGIEVRNLGTQAVSLDPSLLSIDVFASNGAQVPGQLAAMRPNERADLTVPATTARNIEVYFRLPAQLAPEYLNGFRVRWGVVAAEGKPYVQFTQFALDSSYYDREGYPYAYAYGAPYWWYNPFYGPFYPGFSVGVRVGPYYHYHPPFYGPHYGPHYVVPHYGVPVHQVSGAPAHHH